MLVYNCRTSLHRSLKSRTMFFGKASNSGIIFILYLTISLNLYSVPSSANEIALSSEHLNGSCYWSEWMNSDSDLTDGTDIETFAVLRRHGYEFCKKPVDIQCYNIAAEKLISEKDDVFGVTCTVDNGLSCQLFCDDYKVRVACCYIAPDAIGPTFQIESQPSKGCLRTVNSSDLSTSPTLTISSSCNFAEPSQLWSWVSTNQLKNEQTQQCISTNGTQSGSLIVTTNCDEDDIKQRWSYDKSTRTLASSEGYLRSQDGRYTTNPSKSQWLAKLDIGTTDLNTMQGFPCKNPLSAPDFGSMTCSFGSYQGSQCHFSCDYGYRLPSEAIYPAVCMKNGQYNSTSPICQSIVCNPSLTNPTNGEVECSNSNKVDSSCIFKCNFGYKLEADSSQSICLESGNWDHYPPPKCERITCSDLSTLDMPNVEINCTQENVYNSRCSYSCIPGYEVIGPTEQTCLKSGKWSDTTPLCQKIQCPPLATLTSGITTCSSKRYYMSSCQYACNEGYTMVGSGSTVCNSDGSWSSTPPTCQRKTCNKLSAPDHGTLSCSEESFFSSECRFQCSTGYQIKGESLLTCTAEGWNHGSPECIRIVCTPRLLSPVNGELQCSDEEYFGSRCTFSCQTGHEIKGSQVVVCEEGGWNDTSPSCPKIQCPVFQNPRNGQVICYPGNEYGSLCFFNCNVGYTKSSTNTAPVVCTESGSWSRQAETCKRIQCRKLTTLRKGTITCSEKNNYKSNCTFKCNDGFNLYGATEAICDVNGWDAQTPTCGRVVCNPPLAQPADGKIKCTTRGALTCTFTCNNGFRLIGNNRAQCQSDETWSNSEIPTCERIQCSRGARSPTHGSVKCTNGNLYGSECNYTCNKGYVRVGEQLALCNDQGDWSAKAPTCERISCSSLADLSNGHTTCDDGDYYGSKCQFSCTQGYQLIGAKFALCQINSTWSARLPYCERITCSPGFSNPSNGRVTCSEFNSFGSICMFHCDDGFDLQGSSQTTCNADGWSVTKAPSCKKITCPVTSNQLEFGSVSCDRSNEYKSLCEYECNQGYERIGAENRTCKRNGQWTNSKPHCQKIKCPPAPKIANGKTLCLQRELGYGSECVFVCDDSYRRIGTSKVICQEDKTWSPKPFPVCELIPTTQPPTTTTTMASTVTAPTTALPILETTVTTSPPATDGPTPPRNFVATTPNLILPMPPMVPTESTTPVATTTTPSTPTTSSTAATTTANAEDATDDGIPIIPIVISIIGAVLVVVCIVLFVAWRRRSRKPTYNNGKGKAMIPMHEHRYDDSQLQKLIPNGSTNRKINPIPLDRLESEFSRKHADDDKLFREEYSSLPEVNGTRETGGKAANKDKNRYTNIIPFDHSRVVLPKTFDSESDYINASFIDGYKHKGKFIAAQGPKEGTINDFWRMIWDQNVMTIIMVTNLAEGKESKCAQYWPQSSSSVYGDLNVVFLGENHWVDYTVRKFTIQQVKGDATLNRRRNLIQYHFTSWPDFGVPKSPSGMLKFLRKIKHGSPTGYGAIVVHCSAGVGRTGTFIGIDAMVDMMLRENKVDIYGFTSQMRAQRPEMVQTEQQYIFIYQALLEHHLYGDTEVEVNEMSAHITELNQRMPGNVTGMEHEFKKLTTIRIQKEQMRAGNHPANMRKNRVLLILPYDWNRVILPIKRGVENTDYINASYIEGYRQKDTYIATQGPLPHTVEDFWRLIWESQSASIVMLTELVERGQGKCEQYWPNDGAMIYGDLQVENLAEEQLENYTTRDFVVTSTSDQGDRKHIVRQFHYHGWPETGPPVSGYSMIVLVEQVQKHQQTSGNHPITVHCSAGAGRTGAFCALSTALEQVKAEGVLDMFQIVKCLRMQRPHMVQNLEQYEFCYQTVQEYIDSMSEYYNFK